MNGYTERPPVIFNPTHMTTRVEISGFALHPELCKKPEPNERQWHKPRPALRGDTRTKKDWEH